MPNSLSSEASICVIHICNTYMCMQVSTQNATPTYSTKHKTHIPTCNTHMHTWYLHIYGVFHCKVLPQHFHFLLDIQPNMKLRFPCIMQSKIKCKSLTWKRKIQNWIASRWKKKDLQRSCAFDQKFALDCTLIERTPPPRGGFRFTMFPDQEPCVRDFTTRCDRRISSWNLLPPALDQGA